MTPLKDVTLSEVKRAAAKSTKEAIQCSLRHWRYIDSISYRNLMRRTHPPFDTDHCALCQRFNPDVKEGGCDACPLYKRKQGCLSDNSPYDELCTAHDILLVHWANFQFGPVLKSKAARQARIEFFWRKWRVGVMRMIWCLEECLITQVAREKSEDK